MTQILTAVSFCVIALLPVFCHNARTMEFHGSEIAPAMRNTQEKNHDFLAQAKLMSRDPAGEQDWVERYAAHFRELYKTDDAFRDLVNEDLTEEALTRIQRRLDEPPAHEKAA